MDKTQLKLELKYLQQLMKVLRKVDSKTVKKYSQYEYEFGATLTLNGLEYDNTYNGEYFPVFYTKEDLKDLLKDKILLKKDLINRIKTNI